MKTWLGVLCVLALSSVAKAEPESILFQIKGSDLVRLPLEIFRSEDDYRRILTRKDQLLRKHAGTVGMSVKKLMSPVRNQGARGTCSVFAAVSLLELFTGEDYSEQCLARQASNEDRGFIDQRLSHVRRHGIHYESDCPYDASQRDNIPDVSHASKKRFDQEFETFPFDHDDPIAYLKSRLAVSTAVGANVYVVGGGQWGVGTDIYLPDAVTVAKECGFLKKCAAHAIVITGINDDLQLIEFKNSWGKYWGIEGYGYMGYDYFLSLGYGNMVSY